MISIHLIFNHKNYFQKGQNSRKQAKNKTQKNPKKPKNLTKQKTMLEKIMKRVVIQLKIIKIRESQKNFKMRISATFKCWIGELL